jgi:hypothetical protein
MTELTIKTNNQPRRLFFACELSQPERAKLRQEYDWMDANEFDHSCSFFKYRGQYHSLSDFMRNTNPDGIFKGWHGITSDSCFSGLLIKLCGNDVVVGRYFC